MLFDLDFDIVEGREIPVVLDLDRFVDLPDRIRDVAYDLLLWEVDRVDFGRSETNMQDLEAAFVHEEGRLLDHVVADVDDEVCGSDGIGR